MKSDDLFFEFPSTQHDNLMESFKLDALFL
jgi:hypothetical protein